MYTNNEPNATLTGLHTNNRVVEIDYLKTIAMLLVIWGHLLECFYSSYSNLVYQMIYMFHMPLFVFISGYLTKFKYKDLVKFCIYYLLFYFLYGVFSNIFFHIPITHNFFYPYWLLWYLISLLTWKISIPLLDKVQQKYNTLTIVVLFLFGIYIGSVVSVNSFFSLSRTLAFYPFFALGYFMQKNNKFGFNIKFKTITKILLLLATFAIFFVLIKFIPFSNAAFYMSTPYGGNNHNTMQRTLIYAFALTTIILLTSIKITKRNIIIETISKNTLTIFLLHGFVIVAIKNLGGLPSKNISILTSFGIAILLITTLTLIGVLFQKLKTVIITKLKNKMAVMKQKELNH